MIELTDNQDRIVDCLMSNLHVIYFGDKVVPDDRDAVAKRAIDIAVSQAGKDAVLETIKSVAHPALREHIMRICG